MHADIDTTIRPRHGGRRRRLLAAGLGAIGVLLAVNSIVLASPASMVTPTLLARGTYDAFKVMSHPDQGLFKAEAKRDIDVVVRRHHYAPGGHTGWHAHPYPVFITVVEGTLTFYDAGDPSCTPIVVEQGGGYVDSGRGHLVRNETPFAAVDMSVIIAPVGQAFRSDPPGLGAHCGL